MAASVDSALGMGYSIGIGIGWSCSWERSVGFLNDAHMIEGNITAAEFLAARDRASRDLVKKAEFIELSNKLKRVPRSAERLLFELSGMALHTLADGKSPARLTGEALWFHEAVSPRKLPQFIKQVETVIRSSFDLLGQTAARDRDSLGLELTLKIALRTLREKCGSRFDIVMKELREGVRLDSNDRRLAALERVLRRD